MQELELCPICQHPMAEEEPYEDESGQYHPECHSEESLREQDYWKAKYQAESTRLTDDFSAYERNDPKHPEFLEQADVWKDISKGK